jgi:hypothetical protein
MVFAYIGIAIGVLIVLILIVKISRTNPREVAGVDVFCKKCGLETRGLSEM